MPHVFKNHMGLQKVNMKRQSPTWNLVTHCELQKLRMFPSGKVAWYCGNEFLLQK